MIASPDLWKKSILILHSTQQTGPIEIREEVRDSQYVADSLKP